MKDYTGEGMTEGKTGEKDLREASCVITVSAEFQLCNLLGGNTW